MRQTPSSSGRRAPNRRLDTYIDPAESVTPKRSTTTKSNYYNTTTTSRQQQAYKSPRYTADSREADVVMEKILEFEEIVRTPRQSEMSNGRKRRTDDSQRAKGSSRKDPLIKSGKREAAPPRERFSNAKASNDDVAFISTGYATPSRARTISKPEEQALADNLSPQESKGDSITFFGNPSSQKRVLRTPERPREIFYSEPHRLGARPNPNSHRASNLPVSSKNDTNNFFQSPCGPLVSSEERKEASKIWDFLDPKDDIKSQTNRADIIQNHRREKRAIEDAYRDLMLIPPSKQQRGQPTTPRQKSSLKGGNHTDYRTKMYSDRSLNESRGSFSTSNSSHASSAARKATWRSETPSYGQSSIISDIPKSNTDTSASDYYPRSSDPLQKKHGIMKTGGYRRIKPEGQEYYPTNNDLSHRRVQFSKATDPEINKGASTNVNQSIFNGCGVDNTVEADMSSKYSDEDALETQRQELWAAKLNQLFPKMDGPASGGTAGTEKVRTNLAARQSEHVASKLITGDLRELEEIIRKQASEKKRVQESASARQVLESSSSGSRFDPVPMSRRKNHMYVAYSRFSEDADGVLQVCERTTVPIPNRKDGEVLVKVRASTVSLYDCEARKGGIKDIKLSPYVIPGTCFCGQVAFTERKSAFSKIGPGDIVISLCSSGSNARYLCIPKDALVKVPKKVNPDEAACLPETYLMAFQALHLSHKSSMRYKDNSLRGQSILIMVGGFSDLCRALIELTNAAGADCCYAIVDDKEFSAVSNCGAIPLLEDPQQWLTLVGKQIDILICCNDHGLRTESITRDHLKALNSEGEIILFGKPGDKTLPFLHLETNGPSRLICKSNHRSIKDRSQLYNVFDAWGKDMKHCKKDLEHLLKLLQTNRLRPPVLRRLPLTKVATAHSIVESKILPGFLVCLPWVHERTSKNSRSFPGSDRLEV